MDISSLKINLQKEEQMFIHRKIDEIFDTDCGWTNAKIVQEFETEFRKIVDSDYCIGVSTGSTALESLMIAIGSSENSLMYIPTLTAPPTVLSALHNNSKVVLVDSDLNNFCMDINDLERKIAKYGKGENGTSCVIPVYIGGIMPDNVEDIVLLAHSKGMKVIEDCAHAHGSSIHGVSAGCFGDGGIYSFFLTKTMTSGEGGVVVTNSDEINKKIRMIRNYGKDSKGRHVIKGSSWRMNEFTAAVALQQCYSYKSNISERRRIAKLYDNAFQNNEYLRCVNVKGECGYYKYILTMREGADFDRIGFGKYLKDNFNINLPAPVYERLCHQEMYIRSAKNVLNVNDKFEKAEKIAKNHFCLPIYRGLTDSEIEYIISSIKECINQFVK